MKKGDKKTVESSTGMEQALLENFIMLQKVLLTSSENIKELSEKLSKLLDLLENAGKSLAEKEGLKTSEKSGIKNMQPSEFSIKKSSSEKAYKKTPQIEEMYEHE